MRWGRQAFDAIFIIGAFHELQDRVVLDLLRGRLGKMLQKRMPAGNYNEI